jgi:hypothetical protein
MSDDDFNNLAALPSTPSIKHAIKTIVTAICKLLSNVYLIAVIPIHRANIVMMLGNNLYNGSFFFIRLS